MLILSALAIAHVEVHSPPSIEGAYAEETTALFAPDDFKVTAEVTLAATCPCGWLDSTAPRTPALDGLVLLIPTGVCGETCAAKQAACAASLYNASGLLISRRFNTPVAVAPPSPPGNAPPPPGTAEAEELAAARDEILARGVALGCTALVPASLISANLSNILTTSANWSTSVLPLALAGRPPSVASDVLGTPAGAADMLNVTIRSFNEGSVDCTKYQSVPIVYVVAVPIWLALTLAWAWNTYWANAAHARDLHRLMCWVPIMEFVHGLLSLFNYFSCPWESILSLVYATFWSIVTILKEPVMLLCLLLVAKGWCITRNFLQRREVCVAGSILALLYASVSVQMSLSSPLATIPMVIMYLAMLLEISWSIYNNLRILKAQILALRALGVDPLTTPAHRKYIMFRRLAGCTMLYAALELVVHWVFSNGRHEELFWLFLTAHQLMELLIAGMIGYTFRAQPFNILFQQVQQVAAELAEQMLPSITTIEVKPDMLQGDNLVAWRADLGLGRPSHDLHLPPTLVVLNPGDTELPQMPVQRPSQIAMSQAGSAAAVSPLDMAMATLSASRLAFAQSSAAAASASAPQRPLSAAAAASDEATTAPSERHAVAAAAAEMVVEPAAVFDDDDFVQPASPRSPRFDEQTDGDASRGAAR